MKHGRITPEIAAGLLLLQERITSAGVPPSKLDETLLLATWNVRELGKSPRLDASLHYIAEVLGTFDLVCLVELRDDLSDLEKITSYLGPYWDVVLSDYIVDAGGNRERIGFLFDRRAVTFTGVAGNVFDSRTKKDGEYVEPITWWRPPYMASFRAGDFDFMLLGAHIRWGKGAKDRGRELEKLADWVADRDREKFLVDKDLVVLGDFNVPDTKGPLYRALTARGLRAPKGILGVGHGSNLAKNKRYDQMLVSPRFPDSVTGRGGVLDVFDGSWQPLYRGIAKKTDEELTYQMSDHLPLWMELNTDDDAFDLAEVIEKRSHA